jgi:hypothetical protein
MDDKRSETDGPTLHLRAREDKQIDRWRRNSGAKRPIGAPKGNTNAMRHGVYANKFLAKEERPLFNGIIKQLYKDFVFNKSSDFIQVELVAVYFLKLGRALDAGDSEAAERLDRMIRSHLKDLKATKIAREGEATPKGPETSPADWATAILEKMAGVVATEDEDGEDGEDVAAPPTQTEGDDGDETDPFDPEDPACEEESEE